jgi:hypothetical protein
MMKITTTMIHPETGEIIHHVEDIETVVLDNNHVAYRDSDTLDYHVACFDMKIYDVAHYIRHGVIHCIACDSKMKFKEVKE